MLTFFADGKILLSSGGWHIIPAQVENFDANSLEELFGEN